MTTPEIEKLRAKEASIKKRIAEIQSRAKAADRKQRAARLIKYGIVVDALLKSGELGTNEWVDACKRMLNARDFEIATAEIRSGSSDPAHLYVSQPAAEKQCAPAAGDSA